MAMYLRGPWARTPETCVRSLANSPRPAAPSSNRCPSHLARAQDSARHQLVALGMPMLATSSDAKVSAVGKILSSPFATFSPKARASLPDSLVAPDTVICWPRMAQTASSKGSQALELSPPGFPADPWSQHRIPSEMRVDLVRCCCEVE